MGETESYIPNLMQAFGRFVFGAWVAFALAWGLLMLAAWSGGAFESGGFHAFITAWLSLPGVALIVVGPICLVTGAFLPRPKPHVSLRRDWQ